MSEKAHTDNDNKVQLGAHRCNRDGAAGYRFVVRSPTATAVTLCLFDRQNKESRYPMQAADGAWQVWVAGVKPGQQYGFRVHGQSSSQQPFNPNKLLLDPYGKGVVGKPKLISAADCAWFLMSDSRDNAHLAPKSQIVDETFVWEDDTRPQIPWAQTLIYELHVKGFSRQWCGDMTPSVRGTYAGLAAPEVIAYLKNLGITAVELMPVTYGIDEPHLQQKGLANYWNYNTLSVFAVESNYWSKTPGSSPLTEFKTAVKTLHQAGIEVILDVVFNHTAEAEHNHPTYCQRGLANADFYCLNEDGTCINDTGCGNTINAAHPATQDWIIDCLCYWVQACHIDGFRFDLGAVLGREDSTRHHFNRHAALLKQIADNPVLKNTKFIVEPWDIGLDGYQLGNFPLPFAEWNDRFRDDMRAFFLQQNGNLGRFADRFAGSSDIFKQANKAPHSSINLITAHDGFTLADLVTYNDKHNENNGENNRDGHNHNLSDNHGVEGKTDNQAIRQARGYSQRALLSALLLSNGTPMLLAGDEIGHSQSGNNNAYCQDNATTWLNWQTADADLLHFTRRLIQLRHRIALLNDDKWWCQHDVSWLTPDGTDMREKDWHNGLVKALQICLQQRFLLLINGKRSRQTFILPQGIWQDERQKFKQGVISINHLSIVLLSGGAVA
ncbi:MAG: glycogen debranching enzyme GlgX [Gammaproteobacteria bacterium]|nr:MAG: glycogen debranching enzyme GlgX [Gammaproteobacteria bacterium]